MQIGSDLFFIGYYHDEGSVQLHSSLGVTRVCHRPVNTLHAAVIVVVNRYRRCRFTMLYGAQPLVRHNMSPWRRIT